VSNVTVAVIISNNNYREQHLRYIDLGEEEWRDTSISERRSGSRRGGVGL
jgi:hypothetical protein